LTWMLLEQLRARLPRTATGLLPPGSRLGGSCQIFHNGDTLDHGEVYIRLYRTANL